jgi:hypothetical protein
MELVIGNRLSVATESFVKQQAVREAISWRMRERQILQHLNQDKDNGAECCHEWKPFHTLHILNFQTTLRKLQHTIITTN